jgi:2-oxoglutarate ferredoxin oxidoreductase subunit alpha
MIVLGPSTAPEAGELTMLAFDLADKYRTPVMILADGLLGQMMEPVELPEPIDVSSLPKKDWATTGAKGRDPNIILSFDLGAENLKRMNLALQEKYRQIKATEVRFEETETDDAEIVVAAYGTIGRIVKTVIRMARSEGIKLGLFRPITLWPFPYDPLRRLADRVETILTVEMSAGQMWEDVQLAVAERARTPFYGEMGGVVPTPKGILSEVKKHAR